MIWNIRFLLGIGLVSLLCGCACGPRNVTSEETDSLRAALQQAQRSGDRDRVALAECNESFGAYGKEIYQLRADLDFYRNIVAPRDGARGLRIHRLALQPTDGGGFHYKLTLIQSMTHEKTLRGKATLQVSGMQDGRKKIVDIVGVERPLPFAVKYFQDIEGDAALPHGFEPRAAKVVVTAAGAPAREAIYNWPPKQP